MVEEVQRNYGTDSYHVSSLGWNKGYGYAKKFVDRLKLNGIHKINPRWEVDYIDMIGKEL